MCRDCIFVFSFLAYFGPYLFDFEVPKDARGTDFLTLLFYCKFVELADSLPPRRKPTKLLTKHTWILSPPHCNPVNLPAKTPRIANFLIFFIFYLVNSCISCAYSYIYTLFEHYNTNIHTHTHFHPCFTHFVVLNIGCKSIFLACLLWFLLGHTYGTSFACMGGLSITFPLRP